MLAVLRSRRGEDAPAPEVLEKPRRPAPVIGLALGSGVARGWAHIGVLRVLDREGIRPKIIAGTSIGAMIGGVWTAGYLDELEIFARRLTRRSVFGLLDFSFAGVGLIGGRALRDMLQQSLGDKTIEELPTRFCAVATEFGTGHEVWLTRGHLVSALRASYAMPGVFEPVLINDRWLFDGALVNPVPVTAARGRGADLVIAVNLNNEQFGRGVVSAHVPTPVAEEASAGGGLLQPMWDAAQAVTQYLSGKVSAPNGAPSIASVMVETFNVTQDRIARSRLAGDPPDVMISPKLAKIGLFEFHRAEEAIQLGAEAAERMLPEIREAYDTLSERR